MAKDDALAALGAVTGEERSLLKRIQQSSGHTFSAWPEPVLTELASRHLEHKKRFHLVKALLHAKVEPMAMVQWFQVRGMLHNDGAKTDVAGLITRYINGKLGGEVYEVKWREGTTVVSNASYRKGALQMFRDQRCGLLPGVLVPAAEGNPWMDEQELKTCAYYGIEADNRGKKGQSGVTGQLVPMDPPVFKPSDPPGTRLKDYCDAVVWLGGDMPTIGLPARPSTFEINPYDPDYGDEAPLF